MRSFNNNKPRLSAHLSSSMTHYVIYMLVVVVTFFLTRLVDRSIFWCPHDSPSHGRSLQMYDLIHITKGRSLSWPDRGYGSQLSLKIYVYDEDEVEGLRELMRGRDGKISSDACLRGQWGTQVKIHMLLLQSTFRTRKKEEADLFFVPAYVKCVRMMGGLSDKEINQTYIKVLSQMPYFRRSGGRDHIFVFPSGAGAHLFGAWAAYINYSIILTPEGDRTDKKDTSAFSTWKDIIIPGNVDDKMTRRGAEMVRPLPLRKRQYLANYLGRAQGKTGRLKLIELAKQYPNKLESPELKFNGPNKLGRVEYFQHLGNAKFCLAPRGESSWTLRFYESFFVECVPVLLSDRAELPFQNVLDYSRFSIKWPCTRIGAELLRYLETVPNQDVEKMISAGRLVRCLWVYSAEPVPCSAMRGILWELQRKVRRFHQSAETFWLHNGSVVDRNLLQFSSWQAPLPLP